MELHQNSSLATGDNNKSRITRKILQIICPSLVAKGPEFYLVVFGHKQ